MANTSDFDHEKLKEKLILQIQNRVEAAIDGECAVVYSAYPYDDDGLPVDNLDQIAILGLAQAEDEIWASYVGPVLENPTWLQLTIEANRMIIASGDYHHIYFEAIQVMRKTENGTQILSLDFGS